LTFDIPEIDITLNAGADIFEFDLGGSPTTPNLSLGPRESSIYITDSIQITARNPPGSITWYSSDPNIADVDNDGLVTGYLTGSVKIFAVSEDQERNVTVNVLGSPPTSFYISPVNLLDCGTFQLTPHKEQDPVTWTSLNPDIVVVNSTGTVSVVGIGTAIIEAEDNTGSTSQTTIICTGSNIEFSVEGLVTLTGSGGVFLSLNESKSFYMDLSEDIQLSINSFSMSADITNIDQDGGETTNTINGYWDSLNLEGPTNILFKIKDTIKNLTISGSIGSFFLSNFYLNAVDINRFAELSIDSAQITDMAILIELKKWTDEPPQGGGSQRNYAKFEFNCLSQNSQLEILDIDPVLIPNLPGFDIEFEGDGDFSLKRWKIDYGNQGDRPHIYTRIASENGFSGEFSITGPFDARSLGGLFSITPGYMTIQRNFDNDGYIYIDTGGEYFEINGQLALYLKLLRLRIKFLDIDFEADDFGIHWDQIFPPQGVYLSGTINPFSGSLEITVGEDLDENGIFTYYNVNLPPVPKFTYNVQGLTLNVDATDSYDLDGNIENYYWKWSALQALWDDEGPITSHMYLVHGWKTVKLKVKDNNGKESVVLTKSIYV
jgi:hypothetical protein